jgi:predicted flavoprotein YhiN
MEKASQQLVVIGGGAAGFFCAVNAARLNPSLKVLVLEKSHQLLSKVKVSGGGRCNLTHSHSEISEMIRNYPRGAQFLKKSFHGFFTGDTVNWFEQRVFLLKERKMGECFQFLIIHNL